MSRDILKKMKMPDEEDEKLEYKPPEEELVNHKLLDSLLEQYTRLGEDKRLSNLGRPKALKTEIQILEFLIKETASENSALQFTVHALSIKLADEVNPFRATQYLSAVIQAVYNLDCGNNFVIDIRDWPEESYRIGWYLKGKENEPITLDIYGHVWSCGKGAQYCSFTLHDWLYDIGEFAEHSEFTLYDKIKRCGPWAEYCNFTLHDMVEGCGWGAKHCRFDIMPDVKIGKYVARFSDTNTLRRMNDKGEWEVVSDIDEIKK